MYFQEALALREQAIDVLANVEVTADSGVITLVAQTAESLISNPDQISGSLMVRWCVDLVDIGSCSWMWRSMIDQSVGFCRSQNSTVAVLGNLADTLSSAYANKSVNERNAEASGNDVMRCFHAYYDSTYTCIELAIAQNLS